MQDIHQLILSLQTGLHIIMLSMSIMQNITYLPWKTVQAGFGFFYRISCIVICCFLILLGGVRMRTYTWDEYYEKFYDWAESTQVRNLSALTSIGNADEDAWCWRIH